MGTKGDPLPDDSIVAQAKGAMGGFFSQAITALGDDLKTRVAQNNPPKSAVRDATTAFTVQMIALLSKRVKDLLPDSDDKSGG
ncbi:MAG TPA: hypothetical protein VGF56_10840 [Rhizomicrobium sp.]|jgi:hypothetical protein